MRFHFILQIALGLTSIALLSACHTVSQITGHPTSQPVNETVKAKADTTTTKAFKKSRGVCKECMKLKKAKKTHEKTATKASS